jgi:hypothetical protein
MNESSSAKMLYGGGGLMGLRMVIANISTTYFLLKCTNRTTVSFIEVIIADTLCALKLTKEHHQVYLIFN